MRGDVMGSMESLAIFPVITLIIFVGFFAGLIFYVATMGKDKADSLSEMPLDEEELEETKSNHNNSETEGGRNHGEQ